VTNEFEECSPREGAMAILLQNTQRKEQCATNAARPSVRSSPSGTLWHVKPVSPSSLSPHHILYVPLRGAALWEV
jgi:hypothetical protein